MPHAIVYIRSNTENRELLLSEFKKLSDDPTLKQLNITIENVLVSFGWPDYILVLDSKGGLDSLKESILFIRNLFSKAGVPIETSTVIGLSLEEVALKDKEALNQKP